jgi:ketosteroid isomerase-like protein
VADETAAPMLSAIEAFNQGGVESALAFLDPEIEWRAQPEWLEDSVYRGHDGIRRLAAHWTELFDQYRLERVRVVEAGDDRVVILLNQLGQIRGSGDRIEGPIGYIAEVRGGLVTRVDIYFSWEQTLEAAGVSK